VDDATFVDRFESCMLPPADFGHREHLRLAWLYLRAARFEVAALRFCTSLRAYAAALGKSDRYHETITWAYLALVNERLHAGAAGAAVDFDAFARANPDLFDGKTGALAAFYDAGTLGSPLARQAFLLPRSARTI
jgi:hypothetical protein